MTRLDAVVVGSGPNGLAAAIELARAGRSVRVVEGAARPGGGARTEELTEPGHLHDTCSAIHPLGAGSPFFRSLDLERHGLEWIHPDAPLAHPLDGGRAAVLWRDVEQTAEGLGEDGRRWARTIGRIARDWEAIAEDVLRPPRVPRHPIALARFGAAALPPATTFARRAFRGEHARALFAGNAAHSLVALERWASASFGLVLAALAHAVGWPVPRGGSGAITDALVAVLAEHGGTIDLDCPVSDIADLPDARIVLLDTSAPAAARIARERIGSRLARRLARFPPGPGVVKVDWALSDPIPWTADGCRRAGTVHVGGTLEEVALAERQPAAGRVAERPFVLLAQQSLFDPTRAPPGRQVGWAYAHVPNGFPGSASDSAERIEDVASRIEAQVERFAPGFRDTIVARSVRGPAELEARNANLLGGDIGGGSNALPHLLLRPRASLDPYRLADGLYLCSAATPPGGGVHGLCGYFAARSALRHELR